MNLAVRRITQHIPAYALQPARSFATTTHRSSWPETRGRFTFAPGRRPRSSEPCMYTERPMPFIPPMRCSRLDDPAWLADRRYIAESKLDGQRAQVHIREGRAVACYSRP